MLESFLLFLKKINPGGGGGDVTPDILSRRRFSHMDREISTHIQRHRPRETELVQTSTLTFVH